jgi:hypothetical protein
MSYMCRGFAQPMVNSERRFAHMFVDVPTDNLLKFMSTKNQYTLAVFVLALFKRRRRLLTILEGGPGMIEERTGTVQEVQDFSSTSDEDDISDADSCDWL